MKGKPNPRAVLSLAVSLFLLWVLFRLAGPARLAALFRGLHVPWLAVYLSLSLAGLLLRAQRYRLLLGGPVPLAGLFWVTAVRNAFVDLLPARSGALSFVYLVKKAYGVPVGKGTSTLVAAALYDYLAFVPLFGAAAAVASAELGLAGRGVLAVLAVLAVILVAAAAALAPAVAGLSGLTASLAGRSGGRIGRLLGEVSRVLGEAAEDLAALNRKPGLRWRVLVLSFFIRAGKYASLYFLLASFLSASGLAPGSLLFAHVLLASAAAELSASLPLSGPGGLGTWDAAWTAAFVLMGYGPGLAAAAGLAVHIVSKALEYGLGALGVVLLFAGRRAGSGSG